MEEHSKKQSEEIMRRLDSVAQQLETIGQQNQLWHDVLMKTIEAVRLENAVSSCNKILVFPCGLRLR